MVDMCASVMAVAVAGMCGKMKFGFPLVGQELVHQAFCLLGRYWWCTTEMGWNRVVGYQGALPAIGIRFIKDNLTCLSAVIPWKDTAAPLRTSSGVRSSSLGDEWPSSNETRFGLDSAIVVTDR